eukprot:1152467-Pelagomonas_calceolata.AAC.2
MGPSPDPSNHTTGSALVSKGKHLLIRTVAGQAFHAFQGSKRKRSCLKGQTLINPYSGRALLRLSSLVAGHEAQHVQSVRLSAKKNQGPGKQKHCEEEKLQGVTNQTRSN